MNLIVRNVLRDGRSIVSSNASYTSVEINSRRIYEMSLIRSLCVLFLLILLPGLGLPQVVSKAKSTPQDSNVFALGLGTDTGILGFKYSKWSSNSRLMLGVGVGFEGIIPQVQYPLLEIGSLDLYASSFVWYNPWGFLLTSAGSVVVGGGLGIQRWVRKIEGLGLYLNLGASPSFQLLGEHEGGSEMFLGIGLNFQAGFSF